MDGRRPLRLLSAVLASLVVTCLGPRAKAEDEETIQLDYDAPSACPAREVLLAEVRGRTTRWREDPGASARHFVVRAEPRGAGAHGRVTITGATGASSTRELDGETCAEVVDALALMVALAIDPHASLTASATPTPTVAPAPPVATVPAAPPFSEPPALPVAPPAPAAAPPARRAHVDLAAGAPAVLSGGMAPGLSPGFEPFVEVERGGPTGWTSSLRLDAGFARGFAAATRAGTAEVWRLTGGLQACPFHLGGVSARVAFVPCVAFDAGMLSATGVGTPRGRHETRPWLDEAALGRIEVRVTPRVRATVEGGISAPLLRYQLSFPTLPVYTIPPAAGFFGLGTSVHFW